MYVVSLVSRFMETPKTLENSENDSKVCQWDKIVWHFVHHNRWFQAGWLRWQWLGKKWRWQKEHFRICFSLGFWSHFMGLQEAVNCVTVNIRSWICHKNNNSVSNSLDEKGVEGSSPWPKGNDNYFLRQHINNFIAKEFCVSQEDQAYWC